MTNHPQDDLARVIHQEAELRLHHFNNDDAWKLGTLVRELAVERGHTLVIDIRRFGQPSQQLFFTALPGTTPDNARWVERKANVVARFHRSSYQLGLFLAKSNISFHEKYSLPDADYATHGGSFPLHVIGTGVVGALTVSGLPQRQDHNLVVEALCLTLGRDPEELKLP
ncbi:heme-degrading domain-containing protein [Edaphobacter flagellatus]|uniref:heme-degrading domain-containing protein n=1 Tax=Edaphobacter flagellatus TaxID=1933044 RepID=UPI0021B2E278|nr:heme-degrading domain-containing protein [Edaphobacter flagellatus]